ncbi:MAG: hypothetical protein KIS92_26615, partial [Planctomycetota bacterium]|nr:hypothetical protein [Planctomycetota bacterium]
AGEPARVRVGAAQWAAFTRDLQAKAKSMGGRMQLGASKTGLPAEKNAEAAKAPERSEAKQEAHIERLVVQVPEHRKEEFLAALNAMDRRYRLAEQEKALAEGQEVQKAATGGALRQETTEGKADQAREALVTIEILAEIEP